MNVGIGDIQVEELHRLKAVLAQLGESSSTFFKKQAAGLRVKPVKDGRSSRYPRSETQAIVAALIAGKKDDEIRALVTVLHARRLASSNSIEVA